VVCGVSCWTYCLCHTAVKFMSQLLELIFPKAEALKKKLNLKYTAEENKRLAELVCLYNCS